LFGNSKLAWFRTFLDLPGGVPSHDTFGRVFARLDPDAFERRFVAWATALSGSSAGRLVAVDGKAIRRSFEHAWDASGMAHLVSAYVDANRAVFAQVATEAKSNEIEAIPRLLALLDLAGATVTVDAMGCQTEVARQVVDAEGHYVLAVTDNQPTLRAKVRALLDEAILDGFEGMSHGTHAETCGGHGRVETRRAWVTDEVRCLGGDLVAAWPGLAAVAAVESARAVAGGGTSTDRRYFTCGLPGRGRGGRARGGPRALGGRGQAPPAVGRHLPRGRVPRPGRARGRGPQPPPPTGPEPAQARQERQDRDSRQAAQGRVG
jgi:predicted transposase YbfD/YdcC